MLLNKNIPIKCIANGIKNELVIVGAIGIVIYLVTEKIQHLAQVPALDNLPVYYSAIYITQRHPKLF